MQDPRVGFLTITNFNLSFKIKTGSSKPHREHSKYPNEQQFLLLVPSLYCRVQSFFYFRAQAS